MSLSRVLNHDQPLILRQVHGALEIRGQSVEISRNNRLGLPSYALLNAFRLKAVGILVNVGKDRRSTGKNNRVDRAHKSEGGENYLVARSDIEVNLPSFTFVGAVNSVVLAGATPVFADIDKDTYCLKPESGENYLVARSDIGREESCVERRRPVDHGHRVFCADVFCEAPLEFENSGSHAALVSQHTTP